MMVTSIPVCVPGLQELSSILELVPRPGERRGEMYDADFEAAFAEDTMRRGAKGGAKRGANGSASGPGTRDGRGSGKGDVGAGAARSGGGSRARGTREAAVEGRGGELSSEDTGDAGGVGGSEEVEEGSEEVEHRAREGPSSGRAAKADDDPSGAATGPRAARPPRAQAKGQLLQTFVFSATLTLPVALRRRLRGGTGGAAGGVSLEGLMDRMHFRGEPRIVDLTTEVREQHSAWRAGGEGLFGRGVKVGRAGWQLMRRMHSCGEPRIVDLTMEIRPGSSRRCGQEPSLNACPHTHVDCL
eukprot:349664-Chlamydomonas_euryale.AAC.1